MLKRFALAVLVALGVLSTALAHKPGAFLTWNREISRVFYSRCADCHRKGGSAFSMMTFAEVQPRLNEIQSAILNRRMPPWGAVKGFGDFRNDRGLSQEEIELISDWIDSGAARGNNSKMLPPVPKFPKAAAFKKPKGVIVASGPVVLDRPFILDGLYVEKMPDAKNTRIVAEFPDAYIEPLLWLYEYKETFQQPFLLRDSIELPAGSRILGIPVGAQVLLLPGKKGSVKARP